MLIIKCVGFNFLIPFIKLTRLLSAVSLLLCGRWGISISVSLLFCSTKDYTSCCFKTSHGLVDDGEHQEEEAAAVGGRGDWEFRVSYTLFQDRHLHVSFPSLGTESEAIPFLMTGWEVENLASLFLISGTSRAKVLFFPCPISASSWGLPAHYLLKGCAMVQTVCTTRDSDSSISLVWLLVHMWLWAPEFGQNLWQLPLRRQIAQVFVVGPTLYAPGWMLN